MIKRTLKVLSLVLAVALFISLAQEYFFRANKRDVVRMDGFHLEEKILWTSFCLAPARSTPVSRLPMPTNFRALPVIHMPLPLRPFRCGRRCWKTSCLVRIRS